MLTSKITLHVPWKEYMLTGNLLASTVPNMRANCFHVYLPIRLPNDRDLRPHER
jgi:hypothetical protein